MLLNFKHWPGAFLGANSVLAMAVTYTLKDMDFVCR